MIPIWFICLYFALSSLCDLLLLARRKDRERYKEYAARHLLDLIALTLAWGITKKFL